MNKLVGVLGGMGPMATIDFMQKVVAFTPVRSEVDHVRMLVYNNPQIPSRIEALLPGGKSPLPQLISSATMLEKAGVDFIVMPCHSAHYWLDDVRRHLTIPFYSMIDCTIEEISSRYHEGEFLLLSTKTTVQSGLYQRAFSHLKNKLHSDRLLLPDEHEQQIIQEIIQYVKLQPTPIVHNDVLAKLNGVLNLYKHKVKYIIGGCTEIPLLKDVLDKHFEFIDPTALLAKRVIAVARSVS